MLVANFGKTNSPKWQQRGMWCQWLQQTHPSAPARDLLLAQTRVLPPAPRLESCREAQTRCDFRFLFPEEGKREQLCRFSSSTAPRKTTGIRGLLGQSTGRAGGKDGGRDSKAGTDPSELAGEGLQSPQGQMKVEIPLEGLWKQVKEVR